MQFKKAIYLHGRNLRLVEWYKMKSKSPSDILSYSVISSEAVFLNRTLYK